MEIRTRFAPSPTGFIHLGNIRSALFPWAFARNKKGKFILRIEDTDLERSTTEAVQVILDSLIWLGIDFDEGPYFQSKRFGRYNEIIVSLLDSGHAYQCYASKEELDSQRAIQRQLGKKPKYNGLWRPEVGKVLPKPPKNVQPVIRFRNPLDGIVTWHDEIKGPISIKNEELDDFIICRSDGIPTYNFSVVVDDIDMKITHVIRGDDHVNNTPRQINLFHALKKKIPVYVHLPTVLDEEGEKLSKRNGAMSVLDYRQQGFFPEAILNYLARLGWSHGNDEFFSVQQFITWFDLVHLSKSASQFDLKKLRSINARYLGLKSNEQLAQMVKCQLEKKFSKIEFQESSLFLAIQLFKNRSSTVLELVEYISVFCHKSDIAFEEILPSLSYKVCCAILLFRSELDVLSSCNWTKDGIKMVIKKVLEYYCLDMIELAKPLRQILFGVSQTPSLDQMIFILGKEYTLERFNNFLNKNLNYFNSSRNFD